MYRLKRLGNYSCPAYKVRAELESQGFTCNRAYALTSGSPFICPEDSVGYLSNAISRFSWFAEEIDAIDITGWENV
jgi:hypothetical protein